MAKRVYLLSEARGLSRDLLGGKGHGLAEMAVACLPVPPAFIVTTEAFRQYLKAGEVPGLWGEVRAGMAALEGLTGKRFGRGEGKAPPLLVSVRSGAPVSMPGMMDTVLNLGLTLEGVEALARATGNPRFAWDSLRRLLAMYGEVVLGEGPEVFEGMLSALKAERGVGTDAALGPEDLEELAYRYLRHLEARGTPFPLDPNPNPQVLTPEGKRVWPPAAKVQGVPTEVVDRSGIALFFPQGAFDPAPYGRVLWVKALGTRTRTPESRFHDLVVVSAEDAARIQVAAESLCEMVFLYAKGGQP